MFQFLEERHFDAGVAVVGHGSEGGGELQGFEVLEVLQKARAPFERRPPIPQLWMSSEHLEDCRTEEYPQAMPARRWW